METNTYTTALKPLDLDEELFFHFGVPKGTPLKDVPWQFVRHIVNNTFEPTINIYIGNKKVPFYIHEDALKSYYNAYAQSGQFYWIDPRYRFFGNFYQTGDDSITVYLPGLAQSQKQRTVEEVEGITRLLELKKESSICDCPCGTGRHSIEFAKKGHRVLAADLTYDQIKTGIINAKNDSVIQSLDDRHIIFCLQDMLSLGTSLNQHNCFDAVINMFYSFGFFEEESDNEKVARNFFNLLKPGGKFLMHTDVNMATIRSGKYKFNESRPLKNGQTLKIVDRYNPNTKRINGAWVIGNERKEYSVRVYEVEEFANLCKKVGFKKIRVYSDWYGSPYTEDSEMLIFVAQK